MKKYTNFTVELKVITFKDGSSQYLGKGHSIETDKEVIHLEEGIRVSEAKKIRKPVESTTNKD